jgi:DNA-binding transcriptional LysR family regulator
MNESSLAGFDRLQLVETFIRIVEAGSLSAAAAQLSTSQPTVSRRLQILEKWLGVKLLQRSTHAMSLTEDGERFFARAKVLTEDWAAMEEDVRGVKDDPFGLLRVVVPHAFGQEQLIAPLVEYMEKHTRVNVEWILHDLQPNFIVDSIDCAIQLGVVEDPNVVRLHLAEVQRIVVAAPSLCADRTSKLTPQDLHAMPWIALGQYYRDEAKLLHERNGEEHRIPIKPRFVTDSLYALRRAALAGLGVALASSWAVTEDIAQGRLVHLVPDWHAVSLPAYIVYPYARFYPAKLRSFVEIMRQRIPHLVGLQPLRRK